MYIHDLLIDYYMPLKVSQALTGEMQQEIH